MTWERFQTIEQQEGMEEVTRIPAAFPIPRVIRGRSSFGHLPDGFAMLTYPHVDIIGGRVFIRYSRMWAVERAGEGGD